MSKNPSLVSNELKEKVVGKSSIATKKIIENDLHNRSCVPIVFEELEPKDFIK